ncbi:MAG: SH3 domain-containing protein [Alphaproteobacteria bacterium]|nr:SH3 domain-containing protein [Alphaproteobacteria bacterium]
MRAIVFLFAALLVPANAFAASADNTSHLPLPRFVSLRNGVVNMRTGPGFRYPIKWVYKKRGLPVEVTAEYDIWRRVRDPGGEEGWISKTELTGVRNAFVKEGPQNLFKRADTKTPVVAHLEKGAIGKILSCEPLWCKISFDGVKGFLPKTGFWGAHADETFD